MPSGDYPRGGIGALKPLAVPPAASIQESDERVTSEPPSRCVTRPESLRVAKQVEFVQPWKDTPFSKQWRGLNLATLAPTRG